MSVVERTLSKIPEYQPKNLVTLSLGDAKPFEVFLVTDYLLLQTGIDLKKPEKARFFSSYNANR